jgi:hypothetical protein
MKRKSGFIVRKISGQNVAVAVGETSKSFHGMIKLNDSALIIWNALANDVTEDDIVAAVLEEYDAPKDQVSADVHNFVEVLRDAGIIIE